MYPVDAGLEPAAREVGDGIGQVHGDGARLGRDPGPVAVLAQNLETGDGLAEEKRDRSVVGGGGRGASPKSQQSATEFGTLGSMCMPRYIR